MGILQDAVRRGAPKADPRFLASLAAADGEASRFGVSSPNVVARFLAQNCHETNGFREFTENMNYSAKRLTQVWPRRFPTIADAAPYAKNPEGLANLVYANRMGNGPPASGDGWRYRGGGMTHHTGAAEYARVLKRTGYTSGDVRDASKAPAMVAAAASYWADRNVIEAAQRGDDRTVTLRINGGVIGLEDRLIVTRRFVAILEGKSIPKGQTRAEVANRQKTQSVASAAGAATTGSAGTATVAKPASVGASDSSGFVIAGITLTFALVLGGVAYWLWKKSDTTEITLLRERVLTLSEGDED